MNLGDIYFKTFLILLVLPVLATFLLLGSYRRRLQLTWGGILLIAVFIAPFAGMLLNRAFHQQLFVAWHQAQNQLVPRTGCLTYEPDFSRLYATYQMTLPQFNAWAAAHPLRLSPVADSVPMYDAQVMGFDSPEASFMTDMAENGMQLRVYYKAGVMHLLYFSM